MRAWADVNPFSAYTGRPGVYEYLPDESGHRVRKTINEHGFISTPSLAIAKPANTLRIAFLGGSSVAGTGYGLADEETWPWRVAESLQAGSDRRVEFINGAHNGYTTFESFGRLWSKLRFFSPDIVVLCHGWNEMYYFNLAQMDRIADWRTLPDGSWGFHAVSAPEVTYRPGRFDRLLAASQLFTRLRVRFSTPVGPETGPSQIELEEDYDRRGVEVFRENLRLIQGATDLIGAQLFVVKQATLV